MLKYSFYIFVVAATVYAVTSLGLDVSKNFADILSSLAQVLLAVVAIFGYNQWKKQLIGQSEYDVARKLLKTAYGIEHEIGLIRSPFISIAEYSENKDKEISDTVFAYSKRLRTLNDKLSSFEEHLWEGKAIIAKKSLLPLFDFRHHVLSLYRAYRGTATLRRVLGGDKDASVRRILDRDEKVMFDYGDQDLFRPEMERLLALAENELSKYISKS